MVDLDLTKFGSAAALLTATYVFLGPIIQKMLNRPLESGDERRKNFTMAESAYQKLLDEREADTKSCKDEIARLNADIDRRVEEDVRKQAVIDRLRDTNRRQNETLTVWALELHRQIPDDLNENGEPK